MSAPTTNAAVLPERRPAAPEPSGRAVFAGIFVVSLASLLLELSLTRLFSVILFYHFAFLAISVALLGLGAGGVFAHLCQQRLARWETRCLGSAICAINAVVIVAVLEIVLHIPVALQLTATSLLLVSAIYVASAVPFFFVGVLFSVVFARETRRIAPLYGADLVGGAGACLALVPLLNKLGGPNAILFAALAMAVASLIWAPQRRSAGAALFLVPALGLLIAANYSGKLLDVIYAKGMFRDPNWVEFARWNALSRIEVDRYPDGAKVIVIDADASTYLMSANPRHLPGTLLYRQLMTDPPSVATALRPHGDYAIIGPGGGVDVLRALAAGSTNVTGIEINPLIANTIMRDRYADYAHNLYDRPEVHMNVSDGRSWIRSSNQQFDVVQMTLVDTWASTAAGAFALSENNLYTVEAFREYFDHLRPDGMIAITRWEFEHPREALRVVSVAMEALHRMGIANPARHFIVVSGGPLLEHGVPVTVLAKKTPFTQQEEVTAREHLQNTRLEALYLPTTLPRNAFADLITSNDPYGFARSYEFNVAPVTDAAPFFFFTMKIGQVWRRSVGRSIDWKVNVGVAVLGMVLIISVVAVAAFLVLPLWLRGPAAGPSRPLYYFIAIGLAYILVEIAFIQRFVLFLGHPTYAITVVVFLMLLASGAGSLLSRRWLSDPLRVRVPLALVVAAILVYLLLLPRVLTGMVGLAFGLKLLLSGLLLAPLAFAMGMPFPSGLRALHGAGHNTVEWAWAMNAASSVLGSVLAMVIAIQFGLQVTLACGALLYAAAALLTATLKPQTA